MHKQMYVELNEEAFHETDGGAVALGAVAAVALGLVGYGCILLIEPLSRFFGLI